MSMGYDLFLAFWAVMCVAGVFYIWRWASAAVVELLLWREARRRRRH